MWPGPPPPASAAPPSTIASRAIPTTIAIVAAVAAHFGVPPAELARRHHRGVARPLAANIQVYLARVLQKRPFAAIAADFGTVESHAGDIYGRVRRRRAADPELDRTIAEIEAALGVTP